MKNFPGRLGLMFLVALLCGCAGRDFVRVTDDALVLGKTTTEEVIQRLGTPYRQGTVTKNNRQFKTLAYAYATAGGAAVDKGVIPARSQGFYFLDSILMGYEFTSSYQVDNTAIDSAAVAKIIKGTTTRDEVIRLFGSPGGRYIYPMVANAEEEAINYLYSETRGSAFNLKFANKHLIVSFDKAGIVTNVEFTDSSN